MAEGFVERAKEKVSGTEENEKEREREREAVKRR